MGLEVLAIDGGNEKRDLCLNKLGAAAFIDFETSKDLISDVKAATGGLGPHAVIVVAGNTSFSLCCCYINSDSDSDSDSDLISQQAKSLFLKRQNTSAPEAP